MNNSTDNFHPPINPEDIPLMDLGSLAPLFDTEEEQDYDGY